MQNAPGPCQEVVSSVVFSREAVEKKAASSQVHLARVCGWVGRGEASR